MVDERFRSITQVSNSSFYPLCILANFDTLLDTGAGSSYVSAGLINALKKKSIRKITKHIEMMMNSTVKNMEVFKVQIEKVSTEMYYLRQNCVK